MTLGERTHRTASLRVAMAEALPEHMRELTREIVAVEAGNPGKGHGTALLHQVCAEADKWWITLFLQVRPFGAYVMDEAKLERFYEKFGFVTIQDSPKLMARSPELPVVRVAH